MKKKYSTQTLVYMIIILIGIILIIVGAFQSNSVASTILLSIGTSILASSVIYFILTFFTGDPLAPVTNRMDNLVTDLSSAITLLKQASSTGLKAIWNTRSELSTDEWIQILQSSKGDIKILSYAMAFFPEHASFEKIMNTKIAEGASVQILLGKPSGKNIAARTLEEKSEGKISERINTTVERMKNINNIEIKYHDTPLYASIFIFGDTMLVTPQLYGTRGAKAPLMKIQNIHNEDSLFSSYLNYFNSVWSTSESIH